MMLDIGFPGGKQDAVHDCYVNPQNSTLIENFEMAQFRTENFNSILMAECKGKTTCSVEFPFESFARLPKWSQKLNTLLFAQVSCTQTEEMLEKKSEWGLAAACIGLLICLFFSITIRSFLTLDEINEKLLDLELVTVDDYTVQCRLKPRIYDEFLK